MTTPSHRRALAIMVLAAATVLVVSAGEGGSAGSNSFMYTDSYENAVLEDPIKSTDSITITFSDIGVENQAFTLEGQESKSFAIDFNVSYPHSTGEIHFHFNTRDDDVGYPIYAETLWNITVNGLTIGSESVSDGDQWFTQEIPTAILHNGSNTLEFTIKNLASSGDNSFVVLNDSYIAVTEETKPSNTFGDFGYPCEGFMLSGQESKSFAIDFNVSYPHSTGEIHFHFNTRDDDVGYPIYAETLWNITVNGLTIGSESVSDGDQWFTQEIPTAILHNGSNTLEFTIKNLASSGDNSFVVLNDSYIAVTEETKPSNTFGDFGYPCEGFMLSGQESKSFAIDFNVSYPHSTGEIHFHFNTRDDDVGYPIYAETLWNITVNGLTIGSESVSDGDQWFTQEIPTAILHNGSNTLEFTIKNLASSGDNSFVVLNDSYIAVTEETKPSNTFGDFGYPCEGFMLSGQESKSFAIDFNVSYPHSTGEIHFHFNTRDDDVGYPIYAETLWNITVNGLTIGSESVSDGDQWFTQEIPTAILHNGSNTLEFTIKNLASSGDNSFVVLNDSYIAVTEETKPSNTFGDFGYPCEGFMLSGQESKSFAIDFNVSYPHSTGEIHFHFNTRDDDVGYPIYAETLWNITVNGLTIGSESVSDGDQWFTQEIPTAILHNGSNTLEFTIKNLASSGDNSFVVLNDSYIAVTEETKPSNTFGDFGYPCEGFMLSGQESKSFAIDFNVSYPHSTGEIHFHFNTRDDDVGYPIYAETLWNITVNGLTIGSESVSDGDQWFTQEIPTAILHNGSNTLEFTIKNLASSGDNSFVVLNDSYIAVTEETKPSNTFGDFGYPCEGFMLSGQESKSFAIDFNVSYPHSTGEIHFHFNTRDDDVGYPIYAETLWNITVNGLTIGSESVSDGDQWFTQEIPTAILHNGSNTLEFTIKNLASSGDNSFVVLNDSYITGVDFDVEIIPLETTKMSIGGSLTYQISITNHQGTSDTFTLNITGIDPTWFSIDNSYIIHPDVEKTIPLKVSIPDTALAGVFSINVYVTSSNTGMTKNAMAPLTVVNEPIISDLLPADDSHTGSRDVVFSWRTSVNSTTQVYLKGENETGYNVYNGSSGISHVVTVENLTRNKWYTFYVVSSSSHGTAVSEQRDVFIDNGITFDKRTYNFNIERDYDQRASISVTNTDDKPHDLLLTVNNPYEDLIVGFIGDGSMDTVVTLDPSERKYVSLAIHAQDVLQEDHKLLLNLTNMGEENIHDFAYANVHVHIPYYDFTLEEVSSDPYTLTKTLQIKNRGDTVTDFSVSVSDELKDKIVFQPAINHLRLRTGGMVEFDAIPALSEDFAGMNGTILVQGADQMVNSSADFALPIGKRVFVGRIPNIAIEFSDLYDTDGSPDTNPLDDELVNSYVVNGTEIFLSQIITRVYQDGEPVCYTNVSLTFWNSTSQVVCYGVSDRYGYVVFTIRGPVDNYSYRAEVIGYDVSTETRNFYVDETPDRVITSFGVSWVSASDSDSTFDLSGGYSDDIELDNSPFTFIVTKDTVEENTTAILYLQSNTPLYDLPPDILHLSKVRVKGEISGNEIRFNVEMVAQGDYSATVISYSPSEMVISDRINLTFSDRYENKAVNYSVQVPFPVNSTHRGTLNVDHRVLKKDPNKIINLLYVKSGESKSQYKFTYEIISTQTMDDTILIEVRDIDNKTIYTDTRIISLEADVAYPVVVRFPAEVPGEFEISLVASSTSISTFVEGFCHDIGAAGTWDEFFGSSPLFTSPFTPKTPLDAIAKCAVGFTNMGTVIDYVDYMYNLMNAETNHDAVCIGASHLLKTVIKCNPTANFLLSGYSCLNGLNDVLNEHPFSGGGLMDSYEMNDWYCNNRPVIDIPFDLFDVLDNIMDPFEDPYLIIHFTLPWDRDAYRPHDVHILINDVEIGNITNTTPEGHYIFGFDSSKLNYVETGVAKNKITLKTEHMNGGHYVISSDMKLVMLLRDIEVPVVATNQTEADEIVMNFSGVMRNLPDFSIYSEDIEFLNSEPVEGGMIEINATIYNFGTMNSEVFLQIFDGDKLIGEQFVFIPLFDSKTVNFTWSGAEGSHKIHVKVNPDKTIRESDYTNNEAYKNIFVHESSDITPPIITNITATKITTDSATITWDTNEPCDSLVKYGIESGSYAMEVSDPTSPYVMSHSIALTGLSENTTYYYVVNSTDMSDNSVQSTEYQFTTTATTHLRGDLNHDNQITPTDAAIALQLASTGAHNDAADVSGDGQITSLDALMILQAAAGNIEI